MDFTTELINITEYNNNSLENTDESYENTNESLENSDDSLENTGDSREYTDEEVINIIYTFLKTINLENRLDGICALTLQVDRSSLTGTFIFNYNEKQLLKHYPGRFSNGQLEPRYEKIKDINWTINLSTNLPNPVEKGVATPIPEDEKCYPFCCDKCKQCYNHRLTNESIFNKFKNRNGSSKYIFRVVKKIQYGPLEFIKYFKIDDGIISEVKLTELENKMNSFKIYTCDKHNTYYGINLMSEDQISNYHHAKPQNETEFGPLILSKMQ